MDNHKAEEDHESAKVRKRETGTTPGDARRSRRRRESSSSSSFALSPFRAFVIACNPFSSP